MKKIKVIAKDEIHTASCKHRYIVGYSYRMPQPFFRSLPCDNCGCKIKLSIPWRILYLVVSFIGWIVAFEVAESVHIKFLGTTFLVSLVVFVLLVWIIQQLNRLILRYGKWVEVG
jgi:hypothetical protein